MVDLKDIINKGITPVLRQAGFKTNGQNFHRQIGEVDWCINIQKYRRRSDKGSNSLLFTVNAGVTFEEYHEVFYSTQGVPTENCCPLRARPGQFIGMVILGSLSECFCTVLVPGRDSRGRRTGGLCFVRTKIQSASCLLSIYYYQKAYCPKCNGLKLKWICWAI